MSAPGMTAADALNAKPQSAYRTVLYYSLAHILRACGCVSACRRCIGRYGVLVEPYRCQQNADDYFSHIFRRALVSAASTFVEAY